MNGPPSSMPRVPWRVHRIGTPRVRHSALSTFVGSITRRMWAMSIPCVAYHPSACRKSFWSSMTTCTVRPGTRLQADGSKYCDSVTGVLASP